MSKPAPVVAPFHPSRRSKIAGFKAERDLARAVLDDLATRVRKADPTIARVAIGRAGYGRGSDLVLVRSGVEAMMRLDQEDWVPYELPVDLDGLGYEAVTSHPDVYEDDIVVLEVAAQPSRRKHRPLDVMRAELEKARASEAVVDATRLVSEIEAALDIPFHFVVLDPLGDDDGVGFGWLADEVGEEIELGIDSFARIDHDIEGILEDIGRPYSLAALETVGALQRTPTNLWLASAVLARLTGSLDNPDQPSLIGDDLRAFGWKYAT